MSLKICTKCIQKKDISDYIKKCGMCKPCRSIHRKEYRLNNIEKFKEKDRRHYQKYKNQINERNNSYYSKNSEKIQKQRKELREKNPEKYREMRKTWYMNNLDRRLGIIYRTRVRREIISGKKYLEYLNCSIEKLRNWFEFNFELDGFSWSTYNIEWEIDHVIPCCKFNLKNEAEIKECFSWKNTKPTTIFFNRHKCGRIIKIQVLEHEIRLKLYEKIIELKS